MFIALLCLAFTAAGAQKKKTSGNPIFPGWYADPEATVYGGEYWVFPTYSHRYEEQTFFDAFSSPDLVNWTKHEKILTNQNVSWARRAMWAPALGKPLINDIVNGAQPIDQFVFRDDDGQYYMYYGGWGHCNMVRLSKDLLHLEPFADGSIYKEVTPKNYVEGPLMLKRKGKYYFMWSEGGWTGPDYCVAYAISDSPFGPFKRVGKILEQDSTVATGAGHHSVIKVPGRDEYYIVYHRHPLGATDGNNRVTCIDRMKFNKDGYIEPVKMTFKGVKARKIK